MDRWGTLTFYEFETALYLFFRIHYLMRPKQTNVDYDNNTSLDAVYDLTIERNEKEGGANTANRVDKLKVGTEGR